MIVSREEGFPYSLLSVDQITGNSTENQRNHFATTRMISEKHSQTNKRHKIVIRELDQLCQKADSEGHLDEVEKTRPRRLWQRLAEM